eukprot:4532432-Prymnesium_polylepis.1
MEARTAGAPSERDSRVAPLTALAAAWPSGRAISMSAAEPLYEASRRKCARYAGLESRSEAASEGERRAEQLA